MTHTSTEQPELLPCPFCGTNPTLEGDGEILWIVCHADSACRRGGMAFGIKKDELETGIASWNRRAPVAQAQRAPLSEADANQLWSDCLKKYKRPGPYELIREFCGSQQEAQG